MINQHTISIYLLWWACHTDMLFNYVTISCLGYHFSGWYESKIRATIHLVYGSFHVSSTKNSASDCFSVHTYINCSINLYTSCLQHDLLVERNKSKLPWCGKQLHCNIIISHQCHGWWYNNTILVIEWKLSIKDSTSKLRTLTPLDL